MTSSDPVESFISAARAHGGVVADEDLARLPFEEHAARCLSSLTLGGWAMLQDLFEREGVEDGATRALVLWLLSARSAGVLTFNSPARFEGYAMPVLRFVRRFVEERPGAFGRGTTVGTTDGEEPPGTAHDGAR